MAAAIHRDTSTRARQCSIWDRAAAKLVTSSLRSSAPEGKVIGVDFNPPMLDLARKYQKSIGDQLGYHNVEFRRGKIQDLRTNLELVDRYLKENPVRSVADLARLESYESTRFVIEQPLIADESIDVIVSNCVLNLVRPNDKQHCSARCTACSNGAAEWRFPTSSAMSRCRSIWSTIQISGAPVFPAPFRKKNFCAPSKKPNFHGIHIEEHAQRTLSDRRRHRVSRHHSDRLQGQRRAVRRA